MVTDKKEDSALKPREAGEVAETLNGQATPAYQTQWYIGYEELVVVDELFQWPHRLSAGH